MGGIFVLSSQKMLEVLHFLISQPFSQLSCLFAVL